MDNGKRQAASGNHGNHLASNSSAASFGDPLERRFHSAPRGDGHGPEPPCPQVNHMRKCQKPIPAGLASRLLAVCVWSRPCLCGIISPFPISPRRSPPRSSGLSTVISLIALFMEEQCRAGWVPLITISHAARPLRRCCLGLCCFKLN